jgi:4'-phosphopantetheinyl transferase
VPRFRHLSPIDTGSAQIHLCRVDLTVPVPATETATLSTDELQRASRFVFAVDRRRYCATRIALRSLLSAHLHVDPDALILTTDSLGKPRLDQRTFGAGPTCHFNVSHGGEQALIAITDGFEVGVDIEPLRELDDLWPLAEQTFTAMEQAELSGATPDRRPYMFLSGWTRKEACLKAVGCGLTISPNSFHTGLSEQVSNVRLDTDHGAVNLRLQAIDVDAQTVAAIAWIPTDSPQSAAPSQLCPTCIAE